MKINIKYEDFVANNFTSHLIKELEDDKDLERIVKLIRNKLNIKPVNSDVYLRSLIKLIPDNEIDKLVKEFPFLQDWRKGIRGLIGINLFIITPTKIQLRVRNNREPNQNNLTEVPYEEGVKILLTSVISKNELKSWIDDNWLEIVYRVRHLPSFSRNRSSKYTFERDRLIVYLRQKKNMKWKEIADQINSLNPNKEELMYEDAVQQAFKDFPYK